MEGYYFLCRIREQRQISKERLSAGVCAGKELARFEAGEQELDKEVFDILLQRLGISPDKIEVIFRQDEYTRSDALFRFGKCMIAGVVQCMSDTSKKIIKKRNNIFFVRWKSHCLNGK